MLAGNLGATTVAVTSYKNAPLAKACDYALVAGAPVLGFQVRGMTSQLTLVAILDALCGAVAARIGRRAALGFEAITAVTEAHDMQEDGPH